MEPIINIQGLGKKYRIGNAQPYLSLRDVLTSSLKNSFSQKNRQEFWALQDINLQIERGERMGIIGRNGAGKSTLLKVLSRITPPTKGSVTIRGKVASLLEVGTGFHPELTGRENIYLNGSILGLKKKEIDGKLEEIIDFSGVERFIDTPLKHYSSGMQLRLAFSVAAHLEPEILLIDEVLAVGDMEFQKKCIGKMQEVSQKDGRTILFVSHNMNYITSLCDTAVLLDKGQVVNTGKSVDVISKYTTTIAGRSAKIEWQGNGPGNDIVQLVSIRIIDQSGTPKDSFKVNEKVGIEMKYQVYQNGHILWLGHNVHNQEGINVFDTHNVDSSFYSRPHPAGEYIAIVWIPENFLNTGSYLVSTAIFNHLQHVIHLHEKDVLLFSVYDIFDDRTARGLSPSDFPGVVRPLLNWTITKL